MQFQKFLPLIARTFLAVIFIQTGIDKVLNFAGTQQQIAGAGIPLPFLTLVLTIIVEAVGGTLIIVGFRARLGATLLFIFLILATLVFHNPIVDSSQMIQFLKNLSIMGGLLMIISIGSGSMSLDEKMRFQAK